MAPTMASSLELGSRIIFWLERAAFFCAYTSVAVSPASWFPGFVLSLAFQALSFVRSVVRWDHPELKGDSWILITAEHVAAILLEAYLVFGRPTRLAAMSFLLFEVSSGIRLLLAWWAKQSGEVAKVWARIVDWETEKSEEGNSVAEPVKKKTTKAKPNPKPAEAVGLKEKTSEGQVDKLAETAKGHVDKLEETANSAACCEANDQEVLDTSQAMSGRRSPGEPPFVQPQESGAQDESCPLKKPRHIWAPPPTPTVGLSREHLEIRGEEDSYSLGGGYYESPWAHEREYLLEELDKAVGAVNMYQQLAGGYSEDIHQLTTENLQLASKLEDLTARYDTDREEWELLRYSFKALCHNAFTLAGRKRNEASCAEYYKECCLEYSESKGLLQEENARLEAEVEQLRKQLEESECNRQALEEYAQLGAETECCLEYSESKGLLQEENARLEAEVEEVRKQLEESECKRQALEENARPGGETEELRKQLDESDCKRRALEEEKTGLDINLSGAIALCEVYCFLLKYISLVNRVNS
ncbi:hypothetical protein NL676_038359 [Syzygium grande]|nr:hypothetical protein NL676_038359 [Syzygium grande]